MSEQDRPAIRAIVARFTTDMSRTVVEQVLKERPFSFVATIASERKDLAGLPPTAQEHFLSAQIRGGQYEGVDWNTVAPLDEELIEKMRDTEALFMDTVARLEWKRAIPYATRKRWYLTHLRFWNDYLTRKRINLYLSAWIPHEVPDVLLCRLCQLRGIPTLFFHTTLVKDVSFAASTWEDPAPRLPARLAELEREYAHTNDPMKIPLDPLFDDRYQSLIKEKAEKPAVESVRRKTETERIKDLFWHAPLQFLHYGLEYFTPRGMERLQNLLERRRVIRERNAFYNRHAIEPDLERPFVYFALHFQPEASTTPMAGCFTDQTLVPQMLSACLPENVLIYVKEHPRESGWTKRTRKDYEDLLALTNVRLIARHVDTFALREKCKAVVTCSGSAGLEGLFRQKPVLLFGSRFYQYARGVFRIRTLEDCRQAVHAIFTEGAAPSLKDARLFLKAMQDTSIYASLHPIHLGVTNLSMEEHIANNTAVILTELNTLEPLIRQVSSKG